MVGRALELSDKVYEAELFGLQTELVKLREWVRAEGVRVVVIFEGRDGAGKGGASSPRYLVESNIQKARAVEHDRASVVHRRLSPGDDADSEAARSPDQDRRLSTVTRELSTDVDDHVATLIGDTE